jgi:hypothetical protein
LNVPAFWPNGRVAESGLRHSTRNRAWGNPPWVRIPPLPLTSNYRRKARCITLKHNKCSEIRLFPPTSVALQNRLKLCAFAPRASGYGFEHNRLCEALDIPALFALPSHRIILLWLRDSQALENYWHRPITPEELQAEMERIARCTKQPEVLREIFQALGDDPFLIAECLATPVLARRSVTQLKNHNSLKLINVGLLKESFSSLATLGVQTPVTISGNEDQLPNSRNIEAV